MIAGKQTFQSQRHEIERTLRRERRGSNPQASRQFGIHRWAFIHAQPTNRSTPTAAGLLEPGLRCWLVLCQSQPKQLETQPQSDTILTVHKTSNPSLVRRGYYETQDSP